MTRERSATSAARGGQTRGAPDPRKTFHAARAEHSRFRLDLRRSLHLHRRLAVGIVFLGLVLTAAYLWRYWPVYSAEAVVYIQPASAVQGSEGEAKHWPYDYDPATYDSYVQQQMLSMKRPDVLKSAVGKLKNFQKTGESDQDAAERLGRALKVAREGNSYQVAVKAQAGSAQLAADMANAVAQSYIESTSYERKAGDAQRIAVLRAEAEHVKKELDDDRAKQANPEAARGTDAGATGNVLGASELAGEIARLQSQYDALDSQIQDLTIEDAAPQTAHVAASAVAPGQPVPDGVARDAAILLGAFLLLALLSALAAHRLDPRVYVASDIEKIVGFMPIAELPDSNEVSAGVFEEQLLRLSVAVDFALKQRKLKSCVFTGTGPGTGVTTISSQVREAMEGISRPAVLVDAEGNRVPSDFAAAGESEPSGARPLIRVRRLTEESRVRDGISVLVDAAPLTVSAETEYLVSNNDFVVVVAESGATTRAELGATARALQRLDVSSVGIVLNRVSLARADAEFKDALHAMGEHIRMRSRKTTPEPVRTRRVEAEPRVAPRESVGAPAGRQKPGVPPMSEPIEERETLYDESAVEDVGESFIGTSPDVRAGAAAVEDQHPDKEPLRAEPDLRPTSPPLSASQAQQEPGLPWWLSDPLLYPHTSAQPPEILVHESKPDDQTTVAAEQGSRLSGLRRLFAERGATTASGGPAVPAEKPAPAGVKAQTQKERAASFVPVSEPFSAMREWEPKRMSPAPLRRETPEVTAVPEFLPPGKTGGGKRDEDAASRRERRDTWDDVAVLPSWRGQYRRKE